MRLNMQPLQAHRLAYLIHILIFMLFYKSVSGSNDVLKNASSDRKTCDEAKFENLGMHCCNGKLYNPAKDTCCRDNEEKLTEGLSEKVSKCCELEAYLPLNEMCCNFTVRPKPSPMAECCGKEAFDKEQQLCCGLNKKILTKESPDHRCCLEDQFNIETECCCPYEEVQRKPKDSECCGRNPPNVSLAPADMRSQPHFCGSSPYDPKKQHCCERKHGDLNLLCPSGENVSATAYDPKTSICCNGCLTILKPWMDQCCGDTPYGLAQRGVLCCKNTLYRDRKDEEECSESGVPYKPFEETVCVSKRHKSPGGHCCGEELYQPNKTICCKGHGFGLYPTQHCTNYYIAPGGLASSQGCILGPCGPLGNSYVRAKHIRCCGAQAYSISDPLKKCCEGTLYNLTSEEVDDMQCCGSALMNATDQDVCCTSEDQSLFYPARKGFQCCGHHYYNPALWSCCSGKLRPVHNNIDHKRPSIKESKLQLVSNLNKTQLCNEMFIGTVESVSRSSTVFSNVLKIKGKDATVEPSVFILETPDQCKFFGLTTGKTYFFNYVDVFTDFNHQSVLQSLHFILSKCSQ